MLTLSFPEVKRFYEAAGMHLEAAKELLDKCPKTKIWEMPTEVIYLSGYIVECTLKALLLSYTPPKHHKEMLVVFKTELKHDLERITARLQSRGLTLPLEHDKNVKFVRGRWMSDMRYEPIKRDRLTAFAVFSASKKFYLWANGG
jgi:hypothetical protein